MNLFEMMFVMVCGGVGLVGGWVGFGLLGVVGAAVGFVGGFLALPGLHAGVRWIAEGFWGPHETPACRCGRDEWRHEAHDEHGSVTRCDCGATRKREWGVVYEVVAGEPLQPRWRWKAWRGWVGAPARERSPYRQG